jgi:hypothetical protein
MRMRRTRAKERRPDLEELLLPGVLTALASDFAIFPVRDDSPDSAHTVACSLYFFEPELLATVQEQYAGEIDSRKRATTR